MKKSIIAASAASLAVAALPIAGVFAATSNSFQDTIRVGVAGGCTLENSEQSEAGDYTKSDREFTKDIAAGTVGYLNADDTGAATAEKGTVTVSCNTDASTSTWQIKLDVTNLSNGTAAQDITGGAQTSGETSGWAIKSNATGTTASNPFASYTAAANTTIFLSATANNEVTFNPSYQVYVGPNQAPGTYTGTAVYTVTLP